MNKSTPRVTVCIPTIDRPDLFREAIASVARQSLQDFEILVADNSGRPEDQRRTDAVMAEFPQVKFTLVRHRAQLEVAANFNSMVDAAHGEFWACLPDDDRFCPTFLERSVAALDRHAECDLTFADHWIIRADGTVDESHSLSNSVVFGRASLTEGVYLHSRLFAIVLRQAMCLQAALFRRPAIAALKFVPGILALDQSLFLRLSASATPFNAYYLDERLMEYRVHWGQTSTTTKRSAFLRSEIAAFESVAGAPAAHAREFRSKLSRKHLALGLLEAEQGAHASARAQAMKSVRLSFSLRNVAGAILVTALPGAIPLIRRMVRNS